MKKFIFILSLLISTAIPAQDSTEKTTEQRFKDILEKMTPNADYVIMTGAWDELRALFRGHPLSEDLKMRAAEFLANIHEDSRWRVASRYAVVRFVDGLLKTQSLPAEPMVLAATRVYRSEPPSSMGEPNTRDEAARFLVHYGDARIVSELLKDALSPNSKLFFKRDVVSSAGRVLTPNAIPFLRSYLDTDLDPNLKVATAVLIAEMDPTERSLGVIRRALEWDKADSMVSAPDLARLMLVALRSGTQEGIELASQEAGKSNSILRMLAESIDLSTYPEFLKRLSEVASDKLKLGFIDTSEAHFEVLRTEFRPALVKILENADLGSEYRATAVILMVRADQREFKDRILQAALSEVASGSFSKVYESDVLIGYLLSAAIYAMFKFEDVEKSKELYFLMRQRGLSEAWLERRKAEDRDFFGFMENLKVEFEKTQIALPGSAPNSPATETCAEPTQPKVSTQVQKLGLDLVPLAKLSEETLAVVSGFRHAGALKPEFRPREHWMPLLALDPITPEGGVAAAEQARIVGLKFGAIEKALREYLNLSRDSQADPEVQARLKREVRLWARVAAVELRKLNADHHYGRAAGEQILSYLRQNWLN